MKDDFFFFDDDDDDEIIDSAEQDDDEIIDSVDGEIVDLNEQDEIADPAEQDEIVDEISLDEPSEKPAFAPYTRGNWDDITETEESDDTVFAPEDSPAEPVELEEESAAEPVVLEEEPAAEPVELEEEPAAEPVVLEESPAADPVELEEEPAAEPVVFEEEPTAEPVELEEEPTAEPVIFEEHATEITPKTAIVEETPKAPPVEASNAEPSEEKPVAAADAFNEEKPVAADDGKSNEENVKNDHSVSSDLIRGHINTIILRALYDGDKYGYEIITEIKRRSHDQYSLKEPSLYSALKRLEKDGYVTSYWGGSVAGGRRKYFSLTDAGKEISERNQAEWEYSRTVIDSLISEKDYDFSNPAPTAVDMRVLKRSTSRVPGRESADEKFEYGEEPCESCEASTVTEAATEQTEEIAAERETFEAERARYEESIRQREEMLRLREEAGTRREQALLEREFAVEAEEARLGKEAEEKRLEEERISAEETNRRLEEERLAAEETARRIAEAEENARREERDRIHAEYEEQRRQAEENRKQAEEEAARLRAEAEERERLIAEQDEEIGRARAMALSASKNEQNERIMRMESFTEERAQYEERIREQAREYERLHELELAETERRVRAEEAEKFRRREQDIIHQNYLNLVHGSQDRESVPETYSYYYGAPAQAEFEPYITKPEKEREYRSVIQRLYSSTIHEETPPPPAQPVSEAPVAPPPAPVKKEEIASKVTRTEEKKPQRRSIDGIDFYDLEARAAQDGIRISLSGGKKEIKPAQKSAALVNKGKALFLSALVVFVLCMLEGGLALGQHKQYGNTFIFYSILIWGAGLALLLTTGLMFINRFGEKSLRQTGNLLVNVIVSYALCVIVILIVALASQIDFTSYKELLTFIIFPLIFFFNIIVFGVAYFLQIRPGDKE